MTGAVSIAKLLPLTIPLIACEAGSSLIIPNIYSPKVWQTPVFEQRFFRAGASTMFHRKSQSWLCFAKMFGVNSFN